MVTTLKALLGFEGKLKTRNGNVRTAASVATPPTNPRKKARLSIELLYHSEQCRTRAE